MELLQGKNWLESCRSITGDGARKSLKIINDYISVEEYQIHEISTGTQVFDWAVPKEWYINDVFI